MQWIMFQMRLANGKCNSGIFNVKLQVNNHSFSTFANTISFNISRYPTPVEITNSKDYRGPDKSDKPTEKSGGEETGVKRTGEEELVGVSVSTRCETNSNIEYVPAEYFRGVDTHQFAQSGEISAWLHFYMLRSCNILSDWVF